MMSFLCFLPPSVFCKCSNAFSWQAYFLAEIPVLFFLARKGEVQCFLFLGCGLCGQGQGGVLGHVFLFGIFRVRALGPGGGRET